MGFPGDSVVKNLPGIQGMQVQSLGGEVALEEVALEGCPGRGTLSSVLAWRISWPEKPGGLQSMGLKETNTGEKGTLNTAGRNAN